MSTVNMTPIAEAFEMGSQRDIIAEIASIKSRDVFAPDSERDWTRLDEVSELFFAIEQDTPYPKSRYDGSCLITFASVWSQSYRRPHEGLSST
jgi:hypothetical protein